MNNPFLTEGAQRVMEAEEMGFRMKVDHDFATNTIVSACLEEPDGTYVEAVSVLDAWIVYWFSGLYTANELPREVTSLLGFASTIQPDEPEDVPYYAWSRGF